MKTAFALIAVLFLTSCATPDDEALAPSIQQQKKEARQREEFAKTLPPPR